MDTQQELQKVLSPYLSAMRKAVGAFWPCLDPELCLIHWLCVRNNIRPPNISLQKITPTTPDPRDDEVIKPLKGQSRGPSPDRESTASPLSLPTMCTSARETPASTVLTPLPPAKPTQRTWMRPEAYYSRKNWQVPADQQRPASVGEVLNSDKKAVEPAARAQSAQEVRDEEFKEFDDRPLGLRSLVNVNRKVVDDAKRHGNQVQDLQWHTDGLNDVIHSMRHSLRGKFVANVPLLSLDVLSLEEQEKIVGQVRVKVFEAGANIVQEGEVGDRLYIVERGCCQIFKRLDGHDTFVKRIEKEDFFGELAVMYDVPRAATVVADTDVTVLTLSREDIFSTISSERVEKMRRVARAQFLSGIALFQPLNLKQKVAVAEHLKSRVWEAGEVICRQNEHIGGETQCMYIIEDGDCGVLKEGKGKADGSDMHTMHPGQSFGMLGLLYGAPRAATITAVKRCKTLSISYDELVTTCGKGLLNEMRTAVRGHLIRRIPIFRRVGEDIIIELTKRLREVKQKRWQPIFMEGDQAKSILVLEEGSCIEHHGNINELKEWRYRKSEAAVEEHNNPGTFFGVDCVSQNDSTFNFTLVAITECTVLEIPRELVRSLLPAPSRLSLLDMRAYRA